MRIGDVKGYVPLSLMSDPPPRSAREFMKIGESITLGGRKLRAGPTQHRPGNPDDDHGQGAPSRCAGRGEAEACQEGSDQGIAGTDLDDANRARRWPGRRPTRRHPGSEEADIEEGGGSRGTVHSGCREDHARASVLQPRHRQLLTWPRTPAKKRVARKAASPATSMTPPSEPSPPVKPTRRRTRAA